MIQNPNQRQRAFTLIETVISLGIMAIIMLGLSAIMMIGVKAIPSTTDAGLVDQQIISALNQLRSDLRRSDTITYVARANGDQITLDIKSTGTRGEPSSVEYVYNNITSTLSRSTDLKTESIIIDYLDGFTISFTTEGSDATVAKVFLSNKNAIQYNFELHAALPDKPELQ